MRIIVIGADTDKRSHTVAAVDAVTGRARAERTVNRAQITAEWLDTTTGEVSIGPLTAVTILAELGDARRFSSSREAVRYAGLDITVH